MHQHSFTPSTEHEGYEVCACGTYHSTQLLDRDVLYKDNYWNGQTRSLLKDQVLNLTETESCGISKVDKVMQYIERGSVLEIGCAPGELMRRLLLEGNPVVGVEPDPSNIPEIKRLSGAKYVFEGYFPDIFQSYIPAQVDYIVAMDVLEHVEYYMTFVETAHRLLKKGGKFIFMSPIIYEDGFYRQRDFKGDEHCWLFSSEYLKEYLGSMFSEVIFDRWVVGHETVCCVK